MNNSLNVYTDGGSRGNPGPAACAFVVLDDSGKMLGKRGEYLGVTTNNVAEYQAIIFALGWLTHEADRLMEFTSINFYADSRLVISQLNGIFKVKDPNIRSLLLTVREKEVALPTTIHYNLISREKNIIADNIVNSTLDQFSS